ncbi:hypothetical protein EV663_12716 [Rhodovulum bhavnagarense]|uniref:Uncharacterized protein n=1 Tax=Rhodovulum bhavnagarense TaxID=992286 RepID=A0A4R2R8B6_9RHOB|nr:hypothetical protein EV663_12716 [Rhodovulum bhavnagarense]
MCSRPFSFRRKCLRPAAPLDQPHQAQRQQCAKLLSPFTGRQHLCGERVRPFHRAGPLARTPAVRPCAPDGGAATTWFHLGQSAARNRTEPRSRAKGRTEQCPPPTRTSRPIRTGMPLRTGVRTRVRTREPRFFPSDWRVRAPTPPAYEKAPEGPETAPPPDSSGVRAFFPKRKKARWLESVCPVFGSLPRFLKSALPLDRPERAGAPEDAARNWSSFFLFSAAMVLFPVLFLISLRSAREAVWSRSDGALAGSGRGQMRISSRTLLCGSSAWGLRKAVLGGPRGAGPRVKLAKALD